MKFKTVPIVTSVRLTRGDMKKKPPIFVKGRAFSSLTYRLRGRITVEGGEESFISDAHTLTFIPQGCDYRSEILESGEMYVLHFGTAEPPLGAPACVSLEENDRLIPLFEETIRHYNAKGCDLVCMSMVYRLLAEGQERFHPAPMIPSWLRECKRYMDEHDADPSLRISELALGCSVSEVYFRREFARFYGQSPKEYLKKRRIDHAKLLLGTGLYSVTEVAFRSGFESSAYFSAEFRRMVGVSPRAYQRR